MHGSEAIAPRTAKATSKDRRIVSNLKAPSGVLHWETEVLLSFVVQLLAGIGEQTAEADAERNGGPENPDDSSKLES